jgi:hypothetical protein
MIREIQDLKLSNPYINHIACSQPWGKLLAFSCQVALGIILAMESFYHHPLGIVAYIARLIQFISAIVVLGITAWAARDTKTVTVIYSLVIVCCELLYNLL